MGPMSTTRIQVTPVEADLYCAGRTASLLPATEADVLADALWPLADPTRVRLLRYLAESGGRDGVRLPSSRRPRHNPAHAVLPHAQAPRRRPGGTRQTRPLVH